MGKYGKTSVVSDNIWNYNIGILGESGVGKTTLMKNVCEKLVGDDGYILLNIGKEDGVKCIDGISYEDIPNYKVWNEVTNDIIKNKKTDYPDLKIIISDTLDQLFDIAEPEVIRVWNADNIGKKDFVSAKTLNQACGGFGRGEDAVIDLILNRIWALKSVGVAFFYTGHTKRREIEDAVSGQTYSSLTTNMMQRYFTAVKTKTDVLGIACIDREIIKEKTGKKNIITKQEETRNKISSESRVIKFRDDNYSVDSKSRFANIIEEIPLDADEFIKAITDAINSATKNTEKKVTNVNKLSPKVKEESIEEEISIEDEVVIDDIADETETIDKETLMSEIREKFKEADKDTKTKIKAILTEKGSGRLDDSLSIDVLNEVNTLL